MKKITIITFMLIALFFGLATTVNATEVGITTEAELSEALIAGGTCKLANDIALTNGLVVEKGKDVILDLNGYTIEYVNDVAAATFAISNSGKLTIMDSSGEGTGKITNTSKQPSNAYAYASNTIRNNGELIINGGTIENLTTAGAAYAIDTFYYDSTNRPSLTINGGKIISKVDAIRLMLYADNSKDAAYNLTINGGEIVGETCGIWIQLPSGSNAGIKYANININGGTITRNVTSEYAIYSSSNGEAYSGINVNITGGTFNGSIIMGARNNGAGFETLNVTGGIFNGDICNANSKGHNITISGGKFSTKDGAEYVNYVANEYKVAQNGEIYEVVCACATRKEVAEILATYEANGTKAYFACEKCGNKYLTKDSEAVVTDAELIIPKMIQVVGTQAEVSTEAIDKALTEAANDSIVAIPNTSDKVTEVKLPATSVADVANADKSLEITTAGTTVTIDNKALEEITKQGASEITISVEKVEEKVLTDTQKAAVENKEVAFVFTAEMFADDKEITSFGGGKVKVAIPFTPEENTNASDYKVFYIADDGSITEVLTQYVDGKIIVELEHFSEYALINVNKVVATAPAAPATPGAPASAAPVKDNTPKTGAISIVAVIMVVALAGYVLTKKEER